LQLKHNYIGTEHILLAIEREGEGLAAKILADQVRDLGALRKAVHELLDSNNQESTDDETAHRTTAADEVVTVARALAGDATMGSHHLLEALIRAEGSMAAKVLSDLGIDAATIAAKVDEFDAEETTDANPEELAARKMELRVVKGESGDEVHVVFRDEATVGYAKLVAKLTGDPITATGPVTGRFVPLWRATNNLLTSLHQSLRDESEQLPEDADRGKAALLVRRVLHDRLRRRGREAG
jgi:ATP-dependent Clp protease ATP-binding subunit ClpA